MSVRAAGQPLYFTADWQLSFVVVAPPSEGGDSMQKQVQVPKRGKSTPEPLDLRTPSGRLLPY